MSRKKRDRFYEPREAVEADIGVMLWRGKHRNQMRREDEDRHYHAWRRGLQSDPLGNMRTCACGFIVDVSTGRAYTPLFCEVCGAIIEGDFCADCAIPAEQDVLDVSKPGDLTIIVSDLFFTRFGAEYRIWLKRLYIGYARHDSSGAWYGHFVPTRTIAPYFVMTSTLWGAADQMQKVLEGK